MCMVKMQGSLQQDSDYIRNLPVFESYEQYKVLQNSQGSSWMIITSGATIGRRADIRTNMRMCG